jgi:hypothetical protein
MAWRLAKSLAALREEINALSPNRSKVSDGTIGNAEHATRSSDHNPWVTDGSTGVVTALDITHDPAHGIDSQKIADALTASRDARIKYVISNRRIASGEAGREPWSWRPYGGKNPHDRHVHLSVRPDKAFYDDRSPWLLDLDVTGKQAGKPVTRPVNPVLALGTKGPDVERLQRLLISRGARIAPDSDFGPKTEAAVRAFQRASGLVADGRVGPYTWAALLAA